MRYRVAEGFQFCVGAFAFRNMNFEFFGVALQFVEKTLAIADVASHFGETSEIACFVPYGRDYNAGPETSAVLSNPPAFAFVVARFLGGTQHFFRQSGGRIFGSIET